MSEETINANADLRKSISSVFAFYAQPNPDAWLTILSPVDHEEIEKAMASCDVMYQRFVINRALRNVLGRARLAGIDTYNAQWCLIENDTTDRWLHLFKDSTAKCIIRHSLCGMSAEVNVNANLIPRETAMAF
jgi:hypothetical protein